MKDLEIQAAIEEEAKRQLYNHELIASENYVSDEVIGSSRQYFDKINMRKVIRASVITAAVSMWMSWKTLPESVYAVFLVLSMRMCSRIQDHRLIWVFIWLSLNLVIRF